MNDPRKNRHQKTSAAKMGATLYSYNVASIFSAAGVFIMTRVLYWSVRTLVKQGAYRQGSANSRTFQGQNSYFSRPHLIIILKHIALINLLLEHFYPFL